MEQGMNMEINSFTPLEIQQYVNLQTTKFQISFKQAEQL